MKHCGNCGAPLESSQCHYCKSIMEDPIVKKFTLDAMRQNNGMYTGCSFASPDYCTTYVMPAAKKM